MAQSKTPTGRPKSGPRTAGRAQRDPIWDPYKSSAKLPEPTVCPQCGAVLHHGRWTWSGRPEGASETLCQACHRINDHYPAGIVTLSGAFVEAHADEIVHLARHQEEAERAEHPLNRIMGVERAAADRLVVTTTDVHLPRRIGEAMRSAYKGALKEHFDEQGYSARVDWHRDQ